MKNLLKEIPDATGLDGQRINSWKQFQEDEMESDKNNEKEDKEDA